MFNITYCFASGSVEGEIIFECLQRYLPRVGDSVYSELLLFHLEQLAKKKNNIQVKEPKLVVVEVMYEIDRENFIVKLEPVPNNFVN